MKTSVVPHSLHAWCLAARPKTLSGALVSVMAAVSLAYVQDVPHATAPWVAVLCAAFAALMQIASNFINDLIDFRRGRDGEERLGPERACAQGWISGQAMQKGIAVVLGLAAIVGLSLLALAFKSSQLAPSSLALLLVSVGLSCGAGAFLYTTHLSRYALGDAMVLVFFGAVPVGMTYFLLTDHITLPALLLGLGIGCAVDLLLVVNNFRDREHDAAVGKRTLVVVMGATNALSFYLALGLVSVALLFVVGAWGMAGRMPLVVAALPGILAAGMLPWHVKAWKRMQQIGHGRALNAMLGETSRNILVLTILFCVGLWLQSW